MFDAHAALTLLASRSAGRDGARIPVRLADRRVGIHESRALQHGDDLLHVLAFERAHGSRIWFVLNTPICHSAVLNAPTPAPKPTVAFTSRVTYMRRAR